MLNRCTCSIKKAPVNNRGFFYGTLLTETQGAGPARPENNKQLIRVGMPVWLP